MDVTKYITEHSISEMGHHTTLVDGKKFITTNEPDNSTLIKTYIRNNFLTEDGRELTGWLGGDCENLGFYETQKDAERGMHPDKRLCDLFQDFKEKKVRITIQPIED